MQKNVIPVEILGHNAGMDGCPFCGGEVIVTVTEKVILTHPSSQAMLNCPIITKGEETLTDGHPFNSIQEAKEYWDKIVNWDGTDGDNIKEKNYVVDDSIPF